VKGEGAKNTAELCSEAPVSTAACHKTFAFSPLIPKQMIADPQTTVQSEKFSIYIFRPGKQILQNSYFRKKNQFRNAKMVEIVINCHYDHHHRNIHPNHYHNHNNHNEPKSS
jgi:hypothetical protein